MDRLGERGRAGQAQREQVRRRPRAALAPQALARRPGQRRRRELLLEAASADASAAAGVRRLPGPVLGPAPVPGPRQRAGQEVGEDRLEPATDDVLGRARWQLLLHGGGQPGLCGPAPPERGGGAAPLVLRPGCRRPRPAQGRGGLRGLQHARHPQASPEADCPRPAESAGELPQRGRRGGREVAYGGGRGGRGEAQLHRSRLRQAHSLHFGDAQL
mmetsp:Transcript_25452/g.73003  ORF Transcript_25452/g.73003 Transcript_25452/m.73003 type:complete len:216 (+) Transcript_25452:1269-1916(+)